MTVDKPNWLEDQKTNCHSNFFQQRNASKVQHNTIESLKGNRLGTVINRKGNKMQVFMLMIFHYSKHCTRNFLLS